MSGRGIGLWEALVLGYLTLALAVLALLLCTNRLRRDEILYGN